MKKAKETKGRPPTYDDNYHPYVLYAIFWDNQILRNQDIAERFNVTRETIKDWVNTKPKFKEAYERCRSGMKGMLISAAFREAMGHKSTEKTTSEKGVSVTEKWNRSQAPILKLLLSNFGIKEKLDIVETEQPLAEILKQLSVKLPE